MSAARRAGLAIAALLAGCSVGPRASSYPPAQRPEGIVCTIRLRGPDSLLVGELLAAQDSSAVLVVSQEVWLIPYRTVRSTHCRQAGPLPFRTDTYRLQTDAAKMHVQLSRYPLGVSPDLMDALLAAYRQPGVRTPLQP